jgi:GTP 3',8-cyclase
MLDLYNRKINYLRISVTDRCNLRCRYCMPEDGVCMVKHSDILTYEEIQEVVSAAVPLGIDKVRLTGGEPLIRKDIVELVRMIAAVKGVK